MITIDVKNVSKEVIEVRIVIFNFSWQAIFLLKIDV